jgi:hypothetical protein
MLMMSQVQFQLGALMSEFFSRYGTDAQCVESGRAMRWRQGFCCPFWLLADLYVVVHGARKLFQCQACTVQTPLTIGAVVGGARPPLTTWFLATLLLSRDKTEAPGAGAQAPLGHTS